MIFFFTGRVLVLSFISQRLLTRSNNSVMQIVTNILTSVSWLSAKFGFHRTRSRYPLSSFLHFSLSWNWLWFRRLEIMIWSRNYEVGGLKLWFWGNYDLKSKLWFWRPEIMVLEAWNYGFGGLKLWFLRSGIMISETIKNDFGGLIHKVGNYDFGCLDLNSEGQKYDFRGRKFWFRRSGF